MSFAKDYFHLVLQFSEADSGDLERITDMTIETMDRRAEQLPALPVGVGSGPPYMVVRFGRICTVMAEAGIGSGTANVESKLILFIKNNQHLPMPTAAANATPSDRETHKADARKLLSVKEQLLAL